MTFLEGKVAKSILILMGLVLFGITVFSYYSFLQQEGENISPIVSPATPSQHQVVVPDDVTQRLSQQSASDDVAAITGDLDGTSLSDLDKELQDIDRELGAIQ